MKRILMIHPYFGKLPPYFSEWLYTANRQAGTGIDFLVVTDLDTKGFHFENNVRVKKLSLGQLKDEFSRVLGFNAALERPYKLCDYKPAYGYLFQKDIEGYDFWGYGDIDVLWGDLPRYLTEDVLDHHDRILYLGHFSLYRNTEKMNTLFMQKGMFPYKEVYTSEYVYGFDEQGGVMYTTLKNKVKTYVRTTFANLDWRVPELRISGFLNYPYQVFFWEGGGVYRAYLDSDDTIKTEEYMYLHFQGKKPESLNADQTRPQAFYITKDRFLLKDTSLTVEQLKQLSCCGDSGHGALEDRTSLTRYPVTRKIKALIQKLKRQKNLKERIIILKKKFAYRYVRKNLPEG